MGLAGLLKGVLTDLVVDIFEEVSKGTAKIIASNVKDYFIEEVAIGKVKDFLNECALDWISDKRIDAMTDKEIQALIKESAEYNQILEGYAQYGVPRGIGLLTFTRSVSTMVQRAQYLGVDQYELTSGGPGIILKDGKYAGYYETGID